MTAMINRSFARVSWMFAAVAGFLAVSQMLFTAVAASVSRSGEFERLSSLVPEFLQSALAPALTSFAAMTTVLYFDVLIVMLVVHWAVYVATEPAGDIETGLVDLVLARPLPRHRVVTRTIVLAAGTTVLLTATMGAASIAALALFAPAGAAWPSPRLLATMIAHLTLVAWCFAAAALAACGWARRRAAVLATVALSAAALYLLDLLAGWWPPLRAAAYVSPFYYFHGGEIISGAANVARNLTVLASASAAASGLAYWQFARRDL
jgi:ABC-2 type transport system permease protein